MFEGFENHLQTGEGFSPTIVVHRGPVAGDDGTSPAE
jgi:hypothetical protein